MKNKFTELEARELERQLAHPSGKTGIEVGKNMNETNIGMTLNSIEFLELKNENSVLELGHGNCGHLGKLLDSAKGITYFGLEVSETMWIEAKNTNADKQAEFQLYDGETIPYADNFFDRALAVNTIYFWSNPGKLLNEIERLLRPGGICVLTYGDKEFMQKLPFVGQKFTLFDKNDIEKLVGKTGMRIVEFKDETEHVKSKTGEAVERNYTMVKLSRL